LQIAAITLAEMTLLYYPECQKSGFENTEVNKITAANRTASLLEI
jgi:hypothetical protein